MDSLGEPEGTSTNGGVGVSVMNAHGISIVIDDVSEVNNIEDDDKEDAFGGNSKSATGDNNNDLSLEELTKEDIGLKGDDEDDDVYEGLIRDFRNKMDSLSFKRSNQIEINVHGAGPSNQLGHEEIEKVNRRKNRSKRNRVLMLPASKFQELEEGESYRRDTGSSGDRSRVSSGASSIGNVSSTARGRRRFKAKSRLARKKTVMGTLMRSRTMRKTLRAMHINDVEGQDSDHGYGLPPTNEQKLRMFVLKEIFDTETEYMKLLQFMSEVIAPYLRKMGEDPEKASSCGKDTVTKVLANVRDIYTLHVSFQSAMQEVLVPAPFHTHCIGKIFLDFKDRFKAYDEYCGNFSKAQKVCYDLEKDPDMQNAISEWKTSVESKSRRFLHLEGFVISPVQRLCKYPLFLKELKKYTPPNHKDYQDVTEAQQVMEDVTKSVNESERRQLMIQAIRDMEGMCDTWEQSGYVSKQGFMTKRGGSVKSWYIRWFVLRGYKLAYYNEPTDIRPLGVLDLTSYKTIEPDVSEHVGRPFAFGIKMPERNYYMYTTSEEEKQEWLNVLQWKFDCIERSRRQAHHPFETVVFSSISSFIHPKSARTEADESSNDATEFSGDKINMGAKILAPTGEEDDVFDGERKPSDSTDSETKPRSKTTSLTVTFNDTITVSDSKPDSKKRSQSQKVTNNSSGKTSTKSKKHGLFSPKKDK